MSIVFKCQCKAIGECLGKKTNRGFVHDKLINLLVNIEEERIAFRKLVAELSLGTTEGTMVGVELVLHNFETFAG